MFPCIRNNQTTSFGTRPISASSHPLSVSSKQLLPWLVAVAFLLPLLYQVGLGFTPVQSGLLIMPQAMAAMSTKFLMPRILDRVGYRGVLISNTVILGLLLMLFATVGLATPFWVIVLQAFCYGAFTSLQYTSMNTLVYADIDEDETSNASSIASTIQQMSISFAVAAAPRLGRGSRLPPHRPVPKSLRAGAFNPRALRRYGGRAGDHVAGRMPRRHHGDSACGRACGCLM